tara:strand:+ start:1111 stop:1680 length:570 start_codon:yes stop_codon:yes gene_type:complete
MSLLSEQIIQAERGSRKRAKNFYESQVKDHLTPAMQEFIQNQKLMFIATADATGSCDCSPRFGKTGLVTILGEKTLAYPEFRGNGVFASLGNILENPQIGLLFLDFLGSTVGLHVNGTAERRPPSDVPTGVSDNNELRSARLIEQWVYVTVQEAYIHCSKHVPKFKEVEKKVHWGTDDPKQKSSNYFQS